MRGFVTRMARNCQDIQSAGTLCRAQNANGNADGIVVQRLRVGGRAGVGWGWRGLRPLLGGLVRGVLTLRAVAFSEAAAQDTAEHGEADAADQIEDAGGDASGEIGVQEDRDAKVQQYREDVAEGATRHGVPPAGATERREASWSHSLL